MQPIIATPGLRLGSTDDLQAGPGTYVRNGAIYASALGYLKQHTAYANSTANAPEKAAKPTVFVSRRKEQAAVPAVGSIVTGKVLRINTRMATVAIMMVDASPCKEDYQGIIRSQDVRVTEKDQVKMHLCFRPGDMVRAQVISLGDARSFYLSTAQNELGVILAHSAAGVAMVPISWEEMQCPKTHAIEHRKCAKPF
ncbi:hypothetical protein H4R35_003568 [Dimargaris xerosporica]|nr:hypothetical protein H4R35_003568 [Dimargaris xerosporica]